jgi:hypothetical protein
VIIAGGAWYLTADKTKIIEITKDTTKSELFTVANNEKVVLKNSAVLTIFGGMIVNGETGDDGKNLCVVEKKKKDISVGEDIVPIKTKMSFDHVKPGEYSEVYLDIEGKSGSSVSAVLQGPAVDNPNASGTIGGNGKLQKVNIKLLQRRHNDIYMRGLRRPRA